MNENTVRDGTPVLLIGSKNYSSWSLRPWLFLRKAGFEFREQIVYFDESDYQAQIAALSPSRRVPLLIDEGFKIWDSLAICEYVAELTGMGYPKDRAARAVAPLASRGHRSLSPRPRGQVPRKFPCPARQISLSAKTTRLPPLYSCSLCAWGNTAAPQQNRQGEELSEDSIAALKTSANFNNVKIESPLSYSGTSENRQSFQ